MFDVVLTVFMTLTAVAAFVNYKKKLNDHLKAAIVLGIVGLLFAVVAQVEVYVRSAFPLGVTPTLPTLLFSFLIPVGWETFLYAIFALLSALALYLVGALVAAINDAVGKYVK